MNQNVELTHFSTSMALLSNNYAHVLGNDPITAIKVEQLVQHVSDYYEDVISCMPGNVYWLDKHCKAVGCNKNVLDMFGFRELSEFKGLSFEEMARIGHWTEEALRTFKQDTLEVLRSGVAKLNVEEPSIPFNNKGPVYFLTSRVPLFDYSGAIIGVVGISIDITDRKVMEEDLRQAKESAEIANAVKSTFIANMSHDIRTPLTGIIGLSSLLKQNALNATQQEQAKLIHDCSEQLLNLLNNVLDVCFSNQGTGAIIQNDSMNLRESAQHIVSLMLPSITTKALQLTIDVDKNIPSHVITDNLKLDRVLLNLVDNSCKFTEKGSITLQMHLLSQSLDEVQIKFSVIDTGIGIPENQQQQIFDPFFHIHPSYKETYKGYGVGLYFVKKFVTLLGGQIEVNSEVGVGTTFCFTLSLKVGKKGVEEKPNLALQTTNFAFHANVLLIEDNPVALLIAESLLTQQGCTVTTAITGEDGLLLANTESFDVIITDIGLPGISGTELAHCIREREKMNARSKPVPIIALTAHTSDKEKNDCIARGMDMVITKPLRAEVLQDILSQLFNEPFSEKRVGSEGMKRDESQRRLLILDDYPLFDMESALNTLSANKKLLFELLPVFSESIRQESALLKRAYEQHDWDTLRAISHKLKGGAMYCGAIKMKQACQQVEAILASANVTSIDGLFQQFIQVIMDTQDVIDSYL